MSCEKHLALELVVSLADRFGPGSKVAKEVPGWIEYLTDVECPERPRTRPGAAWWGRVRGLLDELRVGHDPGEENPVRINAARIGQHFGLSYLEARILEFFASYQGFDMVEHVVDRALQTQDVTLPFLIAQFAGAEHTAVRDALRPGARLRASGLLQNDGRNWSRQAIPYTVSDRLALRLPLAHRVVAEIDLALRVLRGLARGGHRPVGPGADGDPPVPSKETIRALIEAADDDFKPHLIVSALTGLRASELRGLRWQDVDFEKGFIHIRQRADAYNQMGEPKSRAGYRDIPAGPMVLNALRRWKLRCPKSDLGLVFPAPRGGILQHTNTQARFRKLQEKVEVGLLKKPHTSDSLCLSVVERLLCWGGRNGVSWNFSSPGRCGI
jgi:integrase